MASFEKVFHGCSKKLITKLYLKITLCKFQQGGQHTRMHTRTHACAQARMCTCTHACMHTHTQPFYGSINFVRDNPDELVPEKNIHPLTSIDPYLLLPSITIHDILPVQYTRQTVFFHNLSPSFLWYTSWPSK